MRIVRNAVYTALPGGRLDYLAGRPVTALLYQHQQHVIDLFVWPDGEGPERGPAAGSLNGCNVLWRSQNGMAFWAVSDLNAAA